MENSQTITYLMLSALITFGTSVIAWLVKRNGNLEQRIEDTTKETIDAMKVAAKLGEKVPEMTAQLEQSSTENRTMREENRELRQRISDLERRS